MASCAPSVNPSVPMPAANPNPIGFKSPSLRVEVLIPERVKSFFTTAPFRGPLNCCIKAAGRIESRPADTELNNAATPGAVSPVSS